MKAPYVKYIGCFAGGTTPPLDSISLAADAAMEACQPGDAPWVQLIYAGPMHAIVKVLKPIYRVVNGTRVNITPGSELPLFDFATIDPSIDALEIGAWMVEGYMEHAGFMKGQVEMRDTAALAQQAAATI